MTQHEDLAAYYSRCRTLLFVKNEAYRLADEDAPEHTDEFHAVLFITALKSDYSEYSNMFKNKVRSWPQTMTSRCQPGRGQLPHEKARPRSELPRTRRSETFSRPVGVGERVPEVEAAEAAGAVRELRREGTTPPAATVRRGQALPIGIGRPPRNERGAVPYMSAVRDMAAATTAGRRATMRTSVRSRRRRTHLRVTLLRKSKSLIYFFT